MDKSDIVIFWHVAMMNHWRSVVQEQISKLSSSNLLLAAKKVFVCALGPTYFLKMLETIVEPNKITKHSENLEEFEFFTLSELREYSLKHPRDKILYFHTKGVSYPNKDHPVKHWREYMQHFVIGKWQECYKKLSDYDSVGCIRRVNPQLHWCGNFWWANADYIQKLPPVEMLDRHDRVWAEMWLGIAGGNFHSLHQPGSDLRKALVELEQSNTRKIACI